MRMKDVAFLLQVVCRFFALGPFSPEKGAEISLPVKPRDLPAGTARIKVVNATGKYVGSWDIDLAHSDPDLELRGLTNQALQKVSDERTALQGWRALRWIQDV